MNKTDDLTPAQCSAIADAAIMLTFAKLHFLTPAEKVKAMQVTS